MADSKPGCLPIVAWSLAIALTAAVGLYCWRMLPGNTWVAPPGTAVHYDDFGFAVLGAETTSVLGQGEQRATAFGKFVIVRLQVINDAKRVEFTFRPEIVSLVNGTGREFHLSEAGQAALAALGRQRCTGPLPAGTRCETELAFEVPKDEGALDVRLTFGGGVLDLLDTLAYGNRRLRLP